ncbi:MAG TPA: serine/threonine-protein kinase [Vicinamibacterales bacterium]
MLEAGTILDGRYEVIEPLAEGGMGAVFRARRRLLGDEVAIKIVLAEYATDQAARERFLRESRACAQLRHPNIVSIYDYNVDTEGRPFLVMELLSGPSLRVEMVGRERGFTIAETQSIIVPVCSALQLAHDHGIVHRDMKPSNVVAHDFGGGTRLYKIVDFGLVRELGSDSTRLTLEHEFVGTFTYASPEQLVGAALDARADQYSVAVIVYELLTGHPPFEKDDPAQLITAVLQQPTPPPSQYRSDLPKWIDIVLGRALAKAPEHRYPTIAAFAAALHGGDGGRSTIVTSGLAPAAAAGGMLGTYDFGERLGAGRLGSEVFRGTHRALGHPVAIRMLRRGPDRNWEAVRDRFLREAKTLQVAHPSILQVRDYGEEGDLVYLVTDFVEGPSLRQLLQQDGSIPWPRLQPLLAQLVEAATAMHRKGGLLCGLSPDIMRVASDEDGARLMISSAGIWQAQDLLATMGDATLHGSGLADLELLYVAPELLTGQSADVRADVFTIGVLAYEMATGVPPYTGANMPALLGAMLRGQPADPRALQPTLPEAAASAIRAALAPSPDARPQTARAFGAALKA